jgi:hypothetical protein
MTKGGQQCERMGDGEEDGCGDIPSFIYVLEHIVASPLLH